MFKYGFYILILKCKPLLNLPEIRNGFELLRNKIKEENLFTRLGASSESATGLKIIFNSY
jgi:hypothetical protein